MGSYRFVLFLNDCMQTKHSNYWTFRDDKFFRRIELSFLRNGKTTQDEYLVILQHLIPIITRVLGILRPHPDSMIMAKSLNTCIMYVFVGFVSRPSQRKAARKENCSLYGLRCMKTAFNTEILENSLFHFPADSCFCNHLKKNQNFPGRSGNPKGDMPTYCFGHFIPKNAWNWKKIDRKGVHTPSTPPWIPQCIGCS